MEVRCHHRQHDEPRTAFRGITHHGRQALLQHCRFACQHDHAQSFPRGLFLLSCGGLQSRGRQRHQAHHPPGSLRRVGMESWSGLGSLWLHDVLSLHPRQGLLGAGAEDCRILDVTTRHARRPGSLLGYARPCHQDRRWSCPGRWMPTRCFGSSHHRLGALRTGNLCRCRHRSRLSQLCRPRAPFIGDQLSARAAHRTGLPPAPRHGQLSRR